MNDSKVKKVEDILNEIKYYMDKYPDNGKMLNGLHEQFVNICKQLNEEYNITFLAEKGAGKTTILDFLLSLNLPAQKLNKKNNRKYEVEEDVLETGAGATTTSEVHIEQSKENTRIIIEPYQIEEMIEIVRTFAQIIFYDAHQINSNEQPYLATELIRGCRNMTRLTEVNKKGEGKEDLAKKLALEYAKDAYELFEEAVIMRSGIEKRVITEFDYIEDELNINKEKAWVKKVFRCLNLVRDEEAPLPKRIRIQLSKNIFDFSIFKGVKKIIDTRGLEVGPVIDRKDIQEIFTDHTNDLILLVDKFNSPSKSILDLIEHYVYDQDLEIINRIAYIVNFKDGEPERVINSEGNVENEAEGKTEKLLQIIQNFKSNRINILEGNIYFCNPRRFLDDEGKVLIEVDDLEEFGGKEDAIEYKKSIREQERQEFVKDITDLVEEYRITLEDGLDRLIERFESLKQEISKNAYVELTQIINYVEEKKFSFQDSRKMDNLFEKYIQAKYPSTLHAINNRNGVYDQCDVFCAGANEIQSLLIKELREFKEDIVHIFKAQLMIGELNNNQKQTISILMQEINKYIYEYIKCINEYFYSKLKKDIYNKDTEEEFWYRTRSRWGQGNGYRNDINEYYRNQLVDKDFNNIFYNEMNSSVDTFIQGIVKILRQE